MYSMGTPVREGGGKALGSKEGIEGGKTGLQSWDGAMGGVINWPDPWQQCNKESAWTFLN